MAKRSSKKGAASGNGKSLVIVESPAKARTIKKYLGPDFEVESSVGHIRDLPSSASEIPADVKRESWARLGVNVDKGFEPLYIVPAEKKKQVKKLKDKLKASDRLYLATDEDREGEAIAWHLVEVLKPTCPVERMVFDEITKTAITRALGTTREIDERLVDAQETRRILDRLYGYEVSPVLWRKVKPKLSAGRVQSVATRLVVERERQRMDFVRAAYWDVEAELDTRDASKAAVEAKLVELAGRRIALGRDFDETTGKLKADASVRLLDEKDATAVAERLRTTPFKVVDVVEKPFTIRPSAPFITSTLQQEAVRKLRFSAQRTMRLAQSLYENGYITYMRTDSTTLSTEAVNAARSQIGELYGGDYLPDKPRTYASKSKNAQEAHEAIRPAGESFRTPRSCADELDGDQLKLYELIWKRTVASQMKDATGVRTLVRIEADAGDRGVAVFTTSGKVIKFAGFLRAYVEGADDPTAELADQERILPPLKVGDVLDPTRVESVGHETQPPARYTEASLIRELEERGIGRPSTYATILQTVQDRGYVWKKGSALVPTFTAFAVVQLLVRHLSDLVDYSFTEKMENGLDTIARGERESGPWLHDFYFGEPGGKQNGDHVADVGLKALVTSSGEKIDPRAVSCIPLGKTPEGEEIAVRVGRYGPYLQVGDSDRRATIPEDLPPDELTIDKAMELLNQAAQGDTMLGEHPETGEPIYLKSGRFGPYVQLGERETDEQGKTKRGGKPKMASLWPSMSMETITLDEAVMLLSFPREVGKHPETGEPITVQDGRFGPYVKMGKETRSLPDHEKLRTVTLDEAVEILKQPKGRRGRAGSASVIAELGKHPKNDLELKVKSGRYGPYVTDGVVNATIPKGKDPASVTLQEGIELIDAREQKLRDQGKDPRKATTRKKASRKTTQKKSTPKARSKEAEEVGSSA